MSTIVFYDDKCTNTTYITDISAREYKVLCEELHKRLLFKFYSITNGVIYVKGSHRWFFVIHKILSQIRWNLK